MSLRSFVVAARIASSVLVSTTSAHAAIEEVDVPAAITLQQALEQARSHHPVLAGVEARIAAAKADGAVAAARWQPRVAAGAQLLAGSVNNSTAAILNGAGLDTPRVGATAVNGTLDATPYPSTLIGVSARQALLDFGTIGVERDVLAALERAERARGVLARLDVDLAVTQAFDGVLAAHDVVAAAEGALTRAQVHRDFSTSSVKSGLRPPIELTRAEADLARFDVERIRAEGHLHIARSVLAAAIGTSDLEVDAVAHELPVTPLPALERALRDLQSNAEVHAQQRQLEAHQLRTRAIDASLRPRLDLTATLSARAGGAPAVNAAPLRFGGWLPEVPNYDVGVLLSWPLWDATVSARSRASRLREDAAKAELAQVTQQTAHAIVQQLQRVRIADRALTALEQAQRAAEANYEQADARFRAGLATSTELADAENLRINAEIASARGRLDTRLTRAALARVTAEIR